jgi:hypothetical protein
MLFDYFYFTVHRLGVNWYLITGPGFRGYETSPEAARHTIDGIIAGQCGE